MQKICSKCDEEFESERGKPGLGNVCPRCLETIRQEQGARQVAEAERRHKLLTASLRSNARHREDERKHDIELDRMGFKRVLGRKFTVSVPK
jgi:DNA-directed RNA polymerase subunit RPC12/RpoP